jgi:protein SCO1/2
MAVRLLALLIVVALLALLAVFVTREADQSRNEISVLGEIDSLEFIDQLNRPFTRENLIGKISVVDFFFSRCEGPCPVMSKHMAELYQLYSGIDRVQFVSITVDPAHDTTLVLAAYGTSQGVTDDRWVFLHAPLELVQDISERVFMLDAADLPAGHSTRFVLVDEQARIRGYYDGLDPASMAILKTHLRGLAKQLP